MKVKVLDRKWKTVQLPEDLVHNIDSIIATPGLGYTSRSEFIKESLRLRIQDFEQGLPSK